MSLTTEDYRRCFDGFLITDCAVRSRQVFYFVALSTYDRSAPPPPHQERTTRVVVYVPSHEGSDQWHETSFSGLDHLRAGTALRPREQLVGVDTFGQVVSMGSGVIDVEQAIPRDRAGPRRGGVRKVRMFDGYTYVSTGNRGLCRREDKDTWVTLCDGLDVDTDTDAISDEVGFDDFDGFGANDLYCVGGQGDVWRFDGREWEQIDFPSNMYLEAVCCGGDGFVYIGAQNGAVWRGRGDTWKLIHRGDLTLPFRDMVWFQDRVYCTSDYGLWEIEGESLREADVTSAIKLCSGNLHVGDGRMLLAGALGAAFHDGTRWTKLFDVKAYPRTGSSP